LLNGNHAVNPLFFRIFAILNLAIKKNYMRNTKIGNIDIGDGVFLAPMEDVTDTPFRIICSNLGADIVYTEFIASEGLVRNARKAQRKLIRGAEERITAIQIFGADTDSMVESAKIVEDSGADILDINFGCWVKKVVRREAGAAMLKQPERMAELTNMLVNAVKIPVTVKTRLGWDHESIVILKVAKMIEEAGAKALAVHCRTRSMGMTGAADWSWIPKIKAEIDIPVILNGDVRTPEDCKIAMTDYAADAVMIGRGCIGYPFIFKRAKEYLQTGIDPGEPNLRERVDLCAEHLELAVQYKGDHGLVEFRKHYSGYLKGYFDASSARKKLMTVSSVEAAKTILFEYYDYLEKIDRLEPVSKEPAYEDLRCESEEYVTKETAPDCCY